MTVIRCIINILQEWQTTWVTVIVVYITWLQWEITHTVTVMKSEYAHLENKTSPDNSILIDEVSRKLSYLYTWFATKIFITAYQRNYSQQLFKSDIKKFKKAHAGMRKNLKDLKKHGFV